MAVTALYILAGYFAIGVVFAIAFAFMGVGRIDRAAHGGPIGFRMLIVPGAAALWPWLLMKWFRGGK